MVRNLENSGNIDVGGTGCRYRRFASATVGKSTGKMSLPNGRSIRAPLLTTAANGRIAARDEGPALSKGIPTLISQDSGGAIFPHQQDASFCRDLADTSY